MPTACEHAATTNADAAVGWRGGPLRTGAFLGSGTNLVDPMKLAFAHSDPLVDITRLQRQMYIGYDRIIFNGSTTFSGGGCTSNTSCRSAPSH